MAKRQHQGASRASTVLRHAATGLDYESYARWLRVGAVAFVLSAGSVALPAIAVADSDSSSSSTTSADGAGTSSDAPSATHQTAPSTRLPRAGSSARRPGATVKPRVTFGSAPAAPTGDRTPSRDTRPPAGDATTPDVPSSSTSDATLGEGTDDGVDATGTAKTTAASSSGSASGAGSTSRIGETAVVRAAQGDSAPTDHDAASVSAAVRAATVESASGTTTTTPAAPAATGTVATVTTVAPARQEQQAVTLNGIVTDVLTWMGLGALTTGLPVPAAPVPMPVESLWLFVRNIAYTLNNQRPTASPTSSLAADGTVVGSLNAVDYDDANLTYAVTSGPAHGTVVVDANGGFVYTPTVGTTALYDRFTVSIDDTAGNPFHVRGVLGAIGALGAREQVVTVALTDAEIPTAQRQSAEITLGSVVSDTLHWIGLGSLANGLALPDLPLPGPLASLWGMVREVQYVLNNQRPTVAPTQLTQAADGTVGGNLNAVDYDDAVLGFAVDVAPSRGTVTVDANGGYVYTPNQALAASGGTDQFTVVVTDAAGAPGHYAGVLGALGMLGPQRVTITVAVQPVGLIPGSGGFTVGSADASTGARAGAITTANPANLPVTYTLSSDAVRGTVALDTATGTFTYTPTDDARHAAAAVGTGAAVATDGFTVTVNGAAGQSISVPVVVSIVPTNAPPTATVAVGSPNSSSGVVTGTVTGTDPDTDTLTYTVGTASTGKGGTVVINSASGVFTYTPSDAARHAAAATTATAADRGDSFDVAIDDGHGGTYTLTVAVAVAPSNTAPSASATLGQPDSSSGAISGTVAVTDADDATHTFSAPATTPHGTVTINPTTGEFTYTPTTAARDAVAQAATQTPIPGSNFDADGLTGWNTGTQTPGTWTGGAIDGNAGVGVNLVDSALTFSPTTGSRWVVTPAGKAMTLQPGGSSPTFDAAATQLGLTTADVAAIRAAAPGTPTNAAWVSRTVELTAGQTYTVAWNYVSTDDAAYNDGSLTTLVYQGTGAAPTVTVNNYERNFALLGFTTPGTGDYSTGSFGVTGWQTATYQVSQTGTYVIGFMSFNMGDTMVPPMLVVDDVPGTTTRDGQPFGSVAPNGSTAPAAAATSDQFVITVDDGHGGVASVAVEVPIA
jgi:VCBS repeat-containing protein